ncbi:MAG: sodium-translocating pyrophosphatase [Chloroflexi bacterium]|nr:sodium-translocating pyrophosphatase [Chloroflexota bacterium]MCY3581564.1 sodium-translocating pyrophosphatase [Chloroflexota bacterium]MCY3717670.1 sodium-translocating pyrophosphatase [Chloroflexota bacterium]MDE2649749.1 sodium-translocating pyrophosphatase [Chloroflexota bacterium]MXX49958.1 sodium-translocating pyrophosphatase [Chloroflexota bacterium]
MMDMTTAVALGVAASIVGLIFALWQRSYVLAQDAGTQRMREIAEAIERGAGAFLQREYRAVAILVAIVTVALVALSSVPGSGMSIMTAVAFVIGALASGLAGYIGMYIAVRANVRTAQAASQSLNRGLRVAFASGTVMSTMVVSLALLGISLLFIFFVNQLGDAAQAASALAGFGFGGTSIAIFARVGGGIYTKAADVGADLVGKTEAGIPEDDPRNPATIADNVGDNVGDVAGMGSDLFESYASSIIAAISLATTAGIFIDDGLLAAQIFPLLVAAAGLIISILASFLVRTEEGADQEQLLGSIRRGIYSASALIGIVVVALGSFLPFGDKATGVIIATLSGLVGGVLIGYFTEYFTADTYGPTQALSNSAEGGAGIVVIRGLALGMMSTLAPVIIVVVVTLLATSQAGLYGVAVAAVGMLSTLGITLATDAYGPVADNAGGIAEMSDLPETVRDRTDALDSLGNTTAATGKGFAIGSAAMTALALTAAFITALTAGGSTALGAAASPAELLLSPQFVTGLFIGGLLPFVFSALTMVAVGDAAQQIVEEVRRQFRELGIMEGKGQPDYERCVAISTDSAIRQMLLPGIIAVGVPVGMALLAVLGKGNTLGEFIAPISLVGVLLGSLVCAFMLAVMMANAGGAWDNAKKYIEAGNLGGKGSDAHKAAVVGDTVGDPFKDTSGPSLNILLKLLAIVSLVIAPLIGSAFPG